MKEWGQGGCTSEGGRDLEVPEDHGFGGDQSGEERAFEVVAFEGGGRRCVGTQTEVVTTVRALVAGEDREVRSSVHNHAEALTLGPNKEGCRECALEET